MKLFVLLTLFTSAMAFAVPNINLQTECFKIKDSIDRKYCQDKKTNLLKKHYADDASKWSKGLSKKDKASKQAALNEELAAKEERLKMLQVELELMKSNQDKLAKVKIKKEKKKNDLKGQVEKALKIKL